MKTLAIALALLAAAPLAASANVTKDDIRKLASAGVGEEVILSFIRSNGPVSKFSADDLVELKQAGATEKVLSTLAAGTAPRPQIVEKQVVEQRVVESPSYSPTTVVYQQPYYSTYYPTYYPSYYSGYSAWPYYSYYPRYSYCGPRVSVGFSSFHHSPRATWSLSFRK